MTRGAKLARGWFVAVASTSSAAASHTLGGGSLPHPILWMLCTALAALLCMGLAGRKLSALSLALSVLGAQGLFHFLFSHTSAVAQLAPEHQGHLHSTLSLAPATAHTGHSLEHAGAGMLWLHLLSALLCFAAIRSGDRALERAVHSTTLFWGRILALFTPQGVIPVMNRVADRRLTRLIPLQSRSLLSARAPPLAL